MRGGTRMAIAVMTAALAGIAGTLSSAAALDTGTAPHSAVEHVARAGDPGVQVSLDGVTFTEELRDPLFGHPPVMVPGDVVTEVLWVRNASDRETVVRLSGTGAWSTSAALAEELLVWASHSGRDDGRPVPVGLADGCALLLSGPVLPPGGVLAVEVSLGFASDTSGRDGHGAQAGIDFVAALREPAEAAGDGADCRGAVVPGLPHGPGAEGPGPGMPHSIASTGTAALLLAVVSLAVLAFGIPLLGISTYRRKAAR